MIFNIIQITLILVAGVLFLPQTVLSAEESIVIQEILYDAKGVDTGKEYIILKNVTDMVIDMTGWDLDQSSGPYYTFPSFTLSPGTSVTIYINQENSDTQTELYTGLTSNMSNTKGPIALFSSTEHSLENLVDYVSYGAGGQTNESKAVTKNIWTENDFIPLVEEGYALVYDGSGNHSTDWSSGLPSQESIETDEKNMVRDSSPPTVPEGIPSSVRKGGILINELFIHGDEWIELLNVTNGAVELSDWTIEDGAERKTTLEGSIAPNGYYVIENPVGKLNNTGDRVLLKDSSGAEIDTVTYGSWDDGDISDNAPLAGELQAIARLGEGADTSGNNVDFAVTTILTKGDKNRFSAVVTTEKDTNKTTAASPSPITETIEKYKEPTVEYTIPRIVLAGESVRFDASSSYSSDGNNLAFLWDFGNGDGLEGILTEYVFHATGTFPITLTATHGENVFTFKEQLIVVDDPDAVPPTLARLESGTVVFISEFLPNPTGSDSEGEWIELQNVSAFTVDLSGWTIDDKDGGSKPYELPRGTVIPSEDFLILDRVQTSIALNNTYDSVRFISPRGKVVQDVSYTDVPEGLSYVFNGQEWHWAGEVTPGEENTYFGSIQAFDTSIIVTVPFSEIALVENGSRISVRGVVIVPPDLFAMSYMYIVAEEPDDNNIIRGIKVALPRNVKQDLQRGDVVTVTGTYLSTGDERRIRLTREDDMEVIDTSEIPIATYLSAEFITDDLLGSYVTISGEVIQKKGSNIYFDDGVEEIRAYIYPNTDIAPSQFHKGNIYEISGILSKTRSGFRLLPVHNEDITSVTVASAQTDTSAPLPVKPAASRKEFLLFLFATAAALIVLIVGLSIKIRRQKAAIDALDN